MVNYIIAIFIGNVARPLRGCHLVVVTIIIYLTIFFYKTLIEYQLIELIIII